jgi:hypothetical protein
MATTDICYIEVEVLDKDTDSVVKGILGGFVLKECVAVKNKPTTHIGYLRIYPNVASNMYCASNLYAIMSIKIKRANHNEHNFYENSAEDQKDALHKLDTLVKALADQGLSNGRNGVCLADYTELPARYKGPAATSTSTKTKGPNTNRSTTYNKYASDNAWHPKKPDIIRIVRKSKKPTKKKLEQMKVATRAIHENTYVGKALKIPKKKVNKASQNQNSVGMMTDGYQDDWQGMHQPGFNYMD